MVMAQARPFLIAGGGIGGLAAALGLAQKGFRSILCLSLRRPGQASSCERDDSVFVVAPDYIRITACRSILPVPVFGNSSTNLISRGYL